MEFTVNCPIDGSVDVGLEDIDAVVLRESERADITFICPHCGSQIAVSAVVPAFLLSAIQALAEDGAEAPQGGGFVVVGSLSEDGGCDVTEDSHADAYCEYFRRQLERITSAEDVLAEIDSENAPR